MFAKWQTQSSASLQDLSENVTLPAVLCKTMRPTDEYSPNEQYQGLLSLGILNTMASTPIKSRNEMDINIIPFLLHRWCSTVERIEEMDALDWLRCNTKQLFEQALKDGPKPFELFMFHLTSIKHASTRQQPINEWPVRHLNTNHNHNHNNEFPPSDWNPSMDSFDSVKASGSKALAAGSYYPLFDSNEGFDFAIYEPGHCLKLYECKYSAKRNTKTGKPKYFSRTSINKKIESTVKQLAPALPGTCASHILYSFFLGWY